MVNEYEGPRAELGRLRRENAELRARVRELKSANRGMYELLKAKTAMEDQSGDFLDVAGEIESRAGAWCYLETGPDGEDWTCGSTLPDRAAEAIRHQAKYLELAQKVIDKERARATHLRDRIRRIAEDAFAFRGIPFRYEDVDADPDMVWRELQAAHAEIGRPDALGVPTIQDAEGMMQIGKQMFQAGATIYSALRGKT